MRAAYAVYPQIVTRICVTLDGRTIRFLWCYRKMWILIKETAGGE